ncbi:MAG: 1-deoxy-D-xylulose-5-phosphate synthase [Muribaculaceae bacterium]|nr:1-deoxy-D-xylulose-5-phosphate synthase [Muribaculaceae bacterium]
MKQESNNINQDNNKGGLLSTIECTEDLRKIPVEKLPGLCEEIREFLIANLSQNPGHFGSSMGAVDIIVALHYVFNTPRDRIVFDVGHQAYAHKLLTGRRDDFKTLRKLNGISGFPNPLESPSDSFICGHAGNSISAALGMAIADMSTEENSDRKTVALIGDASISNGLAFEGLNNTSNNPNNLLIILNDNNMSIDDNVGALHRYLSNLTTSSRYNKVRNNLYNKFRKKGWIGEKGKGLVLRFNNSIKALISKQQNIFEGLNIRYFGPFDGNDVTKVVKVLTEIKDMNGPRILHLCTKKGKGFTTAEENPQAWHAPGLFNPETGEKISRKGNIPWQDVFGKTLVEIAKSNDTVCGITAAMPSGTSLSMLQDAFPERSFDVGISEGHAVTFAGGLAAAGKKPFVAVYSSFLQRAYDNVIHDVAIQGLPVVFCIDRAGIVGEDGVTHHGLFDIAYLRNIPNMIVASPMDSVTLKNLMKTAELSDSPFAIRYPRGKSEASELSPEINKIPIGKGRTIFNSSASGEKVAILTIGPAGFDALEVAQELESEGIGVDVYDMIWASPLDTTLIDEIRKNHKVIITVEDGTVNGGFGSAVLEYISSAEGDNIIKRLGVPDQWIGHGSVDQLKKLCGYDKEAIARCVRESIKNYPLK